jgi:hypothetical protein
VGASSRAVFYRSSANALAPSIVGREVNSLIELSNVIADIYDAAIEPALWEQALASI